MTVLTTSARPEGVELRNTVSGEGPNLQQQALKCAFGAAVAPQYPFGLRARVAHLLIGKRSVEHDGPMWPGESR